MNQESVTSLKGIGEKTAALFKRLGVETVKDLLHNYPRAYDAYNPPVPMGQVEEGKIFTVCGQLLKTALFTGNPSDGEDLDFSRSGCEKGEPDVHGTAGDLYSRRV